MKSDEYDASLDARGDKVALRDIILILWGHKATILGLTVLLTLGTFIVSKFFITPVYKTTFNIVANVPEAYSTKYGEFASPVSANADYINLLTANEVIEQTIIDMGYNLDEVTVESINERIILEVPPDGQNVYPITVKGSDPVEIVKLSNILYENYTKYVDLMVKDRAITHYYNDFTIKLESTNQDLQSNYDLLDRYEALIATTSELIDQEALLESLSDSSSYLVLNDVLNPNYIQLETDIMETRRSIETLENSTQSYALYIEELTDDMIRLDEYYTIGDEDRFETDVVDTSDVFMLSEPVVPSKVDSPNVVMNVVIGLVLGAVLGVVFVLFREYLRKRNFI